MDTIAIQDLEVHYRVGVPEEERAEPQRLLITVTMEHDFAPAAAEDDLARTIDYYAVSRWLLKLGEGREWKLIETLAVEIAETVVKRFGASRAKVRVRKFILPEAECVSVETERSRA